MVLNNVDRHINVNLKGRLTKTYRIWTVEYAWVIISNMKSNKWAIYKSTIEYDICL